MTTVQVGADDKCDGIAPIIGPEPRTDLRRVTSAIAVTAIEDRAVEQDDRLAQTVDADVLHELAKLLPLQEWKDAGKRMMRDGFLRHINEPMVKKVLANFADFKGSTPTDRGPQGPQGFNPPPPRSGPMPKAITERAKSA